jgi:DNA-binding NarL/FixJ family response regulator
MIRVVVVEDHPVVAAGYARLLEQAGDIAVVAESDSAESAYSLCLEHAPDLVITDLEMPGVGGLELVRRLVAREDGPRVLVVSMHEGAELVRRAFGAGALGFVPKRSPPQRLVDAVREVQAGRRYVAPELRPLGAAAPEADEQARLATLTEREFQLFRLLAQGHSIAACAQLLHLSGKTVSNHQTQIREKLGVATSAALAHLAIRCGAIAPSGR